MFKQLKAAIAECHVDAKDKIFATLFDCSEEYLLRRSEEALKTAMSGVDVDKNLILVTRLTSLARVKRTLRLLAEKANETPKVENP